MRRLLFHRICQQNNNEKISNQDEKYAKGSPFGERKERANNLSAHMVVDSNQSNKTFFSNWVLDRNVANQITPQILFPIE